MPAYHYEALNLQGQLETGVLEADSPRHARTQLRGQSLIPLQVESTQQESQSTGSIVLWQARIFSRTALVVWTRQLASLMSAGLPLERALSALSEEADTERQRDLIAHLRAEVNAGAPLAQALSSAPKEFSNLYIAVIASGEQSGRLDQVLEQLASDLESAHNLRSKLLAAALYPAIVSGVALIIVLFLLAYVVPQVAHVFTSSHRALPGLTRFMLGLSEIVKLSWYWLLLSGLITMGVLKLALKSESFREQWDAELLKIPVIGRLTLGYNAQRFASTLALLVGAGVPILKSLQTAAQMLSNQALRAQALLAIDLVREGAPLASALAQNKRLPRLLAMFARLGEQTGKLPEMLRRASEHLSNEIERRSLQLATILEPLLILVMGVIVMLIVLSVMLPILQLNQMAR